LDRFRLADAPGKQGAAEVVVAEFRDGLRDDPVYIVRKGAGVVVVAHYWRHASLGEHDRGLAPQGPNDLQGRRPLLRGSLRKDLSQLAENAVASLLTGALCRLEHLHPFSIAERALRIEDGRDLRDDPARGQALDTLEDPLRTLRHHLFRFHSGRHRRVRVRALSVFERVVYHCVCIDASDPAHPVLEVDAILRDGDADGPLLVAVADFKRMIGMEATTAVLTDLRRANRTETRDGVEYVTFRMWEPVAS